jgi:hypothetical protein
MLHKEFPSPHSPIRITRSSQSFGNSISLAVLDHLPIILKAGSQCIKALMERHTGRLQFRWLLWLRRQCVHVCLTKLGTDLTDPSYMPRSMSDVLANRKSWSSHLMHTSMSTLGMSTPSARRGKVHITQ